MSLKTNLAGITLSNPLVLLSGTAGYGEELADIIDLPQIGGLIGKTITEEARPGNPPPRTVETPSGMLNAIGLENPGFDYFLRSIFPKTKKLPLPYLVSIAGVTSSLVRMASKLEKVGALGLEINISCPNVAGAFNPLEPDAIQKVVTAVRGATKLPLLVKLPPDIYRITRLAEAAEKGGADGLTVANTFPGMAFSVPKRKPALGAITGGLSGPAILPLTLYLVYQVRRVTTLPILGSGGIYDGTSAVAMLLAGATAVGLGTINFIQPDAYRQILPAVTEFLTSPYNN